MKIMRINKVAVHLKKKKKKSLRKLIKNINKNGKRKESIEQEVTLREKHY